MRKEGRRSADRRTTGSAPPQKEKPASVCGARYVRPCPALARDLKRRRARLSAPHHGHAPKVLTLRLGSGPRFLESPDPNGRTLSGTSAASTWQSGHAPDGRCPEPPGSRLQAPSGNRTRPIDRLSPVDVPSMGELCLCIRNGDGCQVLVTPIVTWSFDRRTPLLQPRPADLAQLSIRSMYRTGPRLSSPAKAGEPVNTMLSGDYWMPRFRGARQWRGCPTALCDSIRADFGLDRTPWARSRCS